MKKINKKSIIILIVLIILIIIGLKVFNESRANNTIEITANFRDTNGLLDDEKATLIATNEGESGMAITLPEFANENKIIKYIIEEKDIVEENDNTNIEVPQTSGRIIEKLPGDKIYLTQEEIEKLAITLEISYDTIKVEEQMLYNKKISYKDEDEIDLITVSGYMPLATKIQVSETDITSLEQEVSENYSEYKIVRKL